MFLYLSFIYCFCDITFYTHGSFSILVRDFPFGNFPLMFLIYVRTYCFLNKDVVNKKGLVVKTSLGLIYILPYYFYSFHVIHNFYLTKIIVYLFINICHIPTTFMINKAKKHFSVVICVYCIISCSEIFLSQDGCFLCFTGSTKKHSLVANNVFPISRKCQQS